MKPNFIFLVIDDNEVDQFVISKLLKKTFEIQLVNTASNGIEGLQWLNDNRKKFYQELIILLDIRMPEMGGFEFLTEYDKLPEELKRETKIFMLSSTLDLGDLNKAEKNVYVKKLLNKPLSISELEKMISLD